MLDGEAEHAARIDAFRAGRRDAADQLPRHCVEAVPGRSNVSTKWPAAAETWGLLLKRTGAPNIHFDDYPQLQGYYLPEWSHIAASDAVRFTAALVPIVEREFEASRKEVFLGE